MGRLSIALTGANSKEISTNTTAWPFKNTARKARLRELLSGLIPLGRNDITPDEIKQRADIIAQLQGKTHSDMSINAAMRFFWLADKNHDYTLTLDEWVNAFFERFKGIDDESWRKEETLLENAGIVSRTILALSSACAVYIPPKRKPDVMEVVMSKDGKVTMHILSNEPHRFSNFLPWERQGLINFNPPASMSLQATSFSSGMNSNKGCKTSFDGIYSGSVIINELLSSPKVHGRSCYWEEELQVYLVDSVTKMRTVYTEDGNSVEAIHVYAPVLLELIQDTSACTRALHLMHGQQWTWPSKGAYNECELCKLQPGKITGEVLFHITSRSAQPAFGNKA